MSLFPSRIRVLGAIAALLLVITACGADAEVAEVAGGESLTQGELTELLADPEETAADAASVGDESLSGADLADLLGGSGDGPADGTIDKAEAAQVITGWVRNELFFAELSQQGFELTDTHLADARAELEGFALADPNFPDLDSAVGEELIRAQALPIVVIEYLLEVVGVEPEWPLELCSSHILLETEQDALAAVERLDAGEDFATLAAELSTGPSGPNGGDLGCVEPSTFIPEFIAGAALVDAPGVSAPVESQFGWHVIEVRSFDAVPSEDPAAIQTAVFSTVEFADFQGAALERDVTVDSRYGIWDTSSFSVVPVAG